MKLAVLAAVSGTLIRAPRLRHAKLLNHSHFIEKVNEPCRAASQALYGRVAAFYHEIFVRRMRAAAVAEAKLAGRQ